MRIVIYGIGKADAVFLQSEEAAVMIDCGRVQDAKRIARCLHQADVKKLDALVLSHFDKDHAGGAATLLKRIPASMVYTTYEPEDSVTARHLREAMAEQNIHREVVFGDRVLCFGKLCLQISGAQQNYRRAPSNNSSLIVMVSYGKKKYLFTGDAEEERILEYTAQQDAGADFLKVPNHGRYSVFTELLAKETGCRTAVITCSYSRPSRRQLRPTLEVFEKQGTAVYETKDGDVCVLCTEDGFTVEQKKNESRKKAG